MFRAQPYVYNSWYLLFFLDGCLLSWLDWNNHVEVDETYRGADKSLARPGKEKS